MADFNLDSLNTISQKDSVNINKNKILSDKQGNDKQKLLFDFYDTAGESKDGKLDKSEITAMLDSFKKFDTTSDNKLDATELAELTKDLKAKGLDVSESDVKTFYENVIAEGNSASENLHDYTVQFGEKFTDIIVNSLKAKNNGAEPTAEEIAAAKERFKANNPDAVKERNGVEYLLAGAKIKLEGELEDKNNSEEQEQVWQDYTKGDENYKQYVKIKLKAQAEGLRATWSQDYFYNESEKKHYKYNKETGEFEIAENVKYADKDGSYIVHEKGKNIRERRDKENNIVAIQASTESGNIYTNEAYAAKKLGLKASPHAGTWYDSKKQYYTWDSSNHQFKLLPKNVVNVDKDGNMYDKNKAKVTVN